MALSPSAALAQAYQQFYQPQPIPPRAADAVLPDQHQLTDVVCHSYANAYCQTAGLQMMHRGGSGDIHTYNWLTGFTYGAHFQQHISSFLPYNDPEVCFQPALLELGLQRRYYVTNDAAEFGHFLRVLLLQQLPVRVALNSHLLLGKPGFFPHAVVVVGYHADELAYYETGGLDRHLLNHPGERTTLATLAQAAAQMQEVYQYPWRYNLTVYEPLAEPAAPASGSLAGPRNGRSLAGARTPGASSGAQALRALAEHIGAQPPAPSAWQLVQSRFAAGMYTRRDNATYLRRQLSAAAAWANPAAAALEASSQCFAAIMQVLAQPGPTDGDWVANQLLAAATYEEQVAELLLNS